MKNCVITLLLLLLFIPAYSQDLEFDVQGTYSRPVTKAKLHDATSMNDVIDGYPGQWITNYLSVEILATCNGKAMKAISANGILSAEQKNMLMTADLGTDIEINITYNSKNPVTDNLEHNTMHCSLTVTPETQAEYPGGHQQMTQYLQVNGISKISVPNPKEFKPVLIKFTVNEQGNVADVQVSKSSGDPKTDKVFLEAITTMPKWKPAENAKGVKVKQVFMFRVGNSGC